MNKDDVLDLLESAIDYSQPASIERFKMHKPTGEVRVVDVILTVTSFGEVCEIWHGERLGGWFDLDSVSDNYVFEVTTPDDSSENYAEAEQ